MPIFEAMMRVTHEELWSVEAKDMDDAIKKLCKCDDDVDTDETGGTVVDWEIVGKIKEVEP